MEDSSEGACEIGSTVSECFYPDEGRNVVTRILSMPVAEEGTGTYLGCILL